MLNSTEKGYYCKKSVIRFPDNDWQVLTQALVKSAPGGEQFVDYATADVPGSVKSCIKLQFICFNCTNRKHNDLHQEIKMCPYFRDYDFKLLTSHVAIFYPDISLLNIGSSFVVKCGLQLDWNLQTKYLSFSFIPQIFIFELFDSICGLILLYNIL